MIRAGRLMQDVRGSRIERGMVRNECGMNADHISHFSRLTYFCLGNTVIQVGLRHAIIAKTWRPPNFQQKSPNEYVTI